MSRSEKSILNDTLVDLTARPQTMLWRNNTGTAWQGTREETRVGSLVRVEPGMVVLRDARPVSFGVKGSGDAIGATHGRPLAVETKTKRGGQSEQQRHFQVAWERVGGIYVLVRDPSVAWRQIEEKLLLG